MLERIFNKFFWRGSAQNSKIHWTSWVNCCGSLHEGSLGCKTMSDLVYVFSFKLWFNLRNNGSLWAKFMRAKFCGGFHPSNCFYSKGQYKVWHHLCMIKWKVEPSLVWGLGQGNIFFWQDRWVNGQSLDSLLNTNSINTVKVNALLSANGWDLVKLSQILPQPIVYLIQQIPLNTISRDVLLCSFTKDDHFSTKEDWHYFYCHNEENKLFKMIWHFTIPSTISVFCGDSFISIFLRMSC
ncbi:hypothetical protein KFK09_020409 [Dendrobium nobile]|uniref:Reverse transcriptase zinc-binding domain-containing protein n=1 Tax=Dendrobium nobile TaxID=94219 RepID=A0A8T3ALS9_DENNO|nr:hypothetical protein KFK09_020409 [Dendrobium nobile]